MKPTGIQLVAEFFNCDSEILNNSEILEKILRESIIGCGIEIVSINSHLYDPIGITSIAVISESHVAIHTYPEACHASLDIFTCSKDNGVSFRILQRLKENLAPGTTRVAEISRGNPLEVSRTNWITDDTGSTGFDIRYHIQDEIFYLKSVYQEIKIINNESFGRMLFLDNDLQIAEFDAHIYNECMVRPLIESGIPLQNVAILGGGDGGVLYELLKYNPGKITLVDIDEAVVDACNTYLREICHDAFEDKRVEVVYDDVFRFLAQGRHYDAIIYDLTMHPEAFINRKRDTYLNDLFSRIKASLHKNGIISAQCCSAYDYDTLDMTANLLGKFFRDIRMTESYIPSYCVPWTFAFGNT
ncbi:MAG: adenosylmethionine decarboxylase [Syntrophales bacterium]|nr:adenosylmethionine decarboxylase [Syntrophales bacterium]MDY0045169.1 adenosylmethionine decarboxylase [Syntrophales bacterium]